METAIITGGSRGLGRALAVALVERGWDVVVDARHEFEGVPGADVIVGDVADPVHRAALIGSVERLDLLVNNASILGPSPQPPLAEYPLDVLRDVYEVNVIAPLALIQLALPALERASNPRIVNITSDAAVEPYEGWGGYGSSKAALEQVSAILGREQDVRVWAFDPGDMRTQMHQEAFPGEDISDRPLPEAVVPGLVALIESDRPSGRVKG